MNRRSFIRSTMAAVALTASGLELASASIAVDRKPLLKVTHRTGVFFLRSGWDSVKNEYMNIQALTTEDESGVTVDWLSTATYRNDNVLIDVVDQSQSGKVLDGEVIFLNPAYHPDTQALL